MKIFFQITLLGFILQLSACATVGLLTLNTFAAFQGHYKVSKDQSYGPLKRQSLDVYTPKLSDSDPQLKPSPVVIFFHGGNWNSGSKDQYRFVGEALASFGYRVVIPNYRLYPKVKSPAFIEDGALAVRWVRNNIQAYGGDPKQIFLMGHSAGGQIAMLLTVDESYLKQVGFNPHQLRGTIGLAGPYDFLPFTEPHHDDLFGPPENFPKSQPINFVDGKEAPLLLLYGLEDKRVFLKNSVNLEKKVLKKRGRVKTIYYDKLGHIDLITAFSIPLRSKGPVLRDVVRFLEEKKTHDGGVSITPHS